MASEESANYWAKRRSSRDDKTEGELCAAIARRDHDAVEVAEMSLGEGDRVLVLREEMSREPGWVFATCGDDAARENRTTQGMPNMERTGGGSG